MDSITAVLQQLDLSPTASKIYEVLLSIGNSSAHRIAVKAGTYKANTYEALERLAALGLVTSIREGGTRLFIPTNPNKLGQIVDMYHEQQQQRTMQLRKELARVLPQLQARYNHVKQKELFEIYRGKVAYKALLREILEENPTVWRGFGNLQIQALLPLEFKKWFKDIHLQLFSNKSPLVESRLREARKSTTVDITWLPDDVFMPIVWVVFGDNVLIIIYEPDVIVMRMKSEQVTKTFSSQFDYLWGKYKTN